jgi:hypothetical protein
MVKTMALGSAWVLERRAVLVHAPEFDVAVLCRLRISYDPVLNQPSLSIRINSIISGSGSEPQVLMLSIAPKAVDTCTVESNICGSVVPARMINMLRGVTKSAVVSTLTLCLNDYKSGLVLVPSDVTEPLTPAAESRTDFHAFAKICQATILYLHFSKRQLVDDDTLHLRTFARTLCESSLNVAPVNDAHFNGGRGAQQRDWTVFASDPPPYKQTVSIGSVLGKHYLDADESLPSASNSMNLAPSPYSPPPWSLTEVNTPTEVNSPTEVNTSTCVDSSIDTNTPENANVSFQARTSSTHCQSSPYIRPTFFARETKLRREDALKVQQLREMIETLPDHLVLELLRGPRVQKLLATQREMEQAGIPLDSGRVAVAEVKQSATSHKGRWDDEGLDQKIKRAFESLVHQRLESLVQDQLPVLIREELPLAIDGPLSCAVEQIRDEFHEDCKMNEAKLVEIIDDGRTELHDETDKCTTEINDMVRGQIDELEYQTEKTCILVGEQLACLGYWSDRFAKSNENKEQARNTIKTRCQSI